MTSRHPLDMTCEEWTLIAPLTPKPGRGGLPRDVEAREAIDALRDLVRLGGG